MKPKILLLMMLAITPLAQAQSQWRLEAFLQYFGTAPGTSLGFRVKGFVGSQPNNPYNVAVAEGYNPTIEAARLLFYHITSPQDTTPRWIIPGGANVEHGDFNGDSFTDLAVQKSVNVERNDTILVYLGNATGIDTLPRFKLPAEREGSHFGFAMSAGDLNNDRIDDLVITAPGKVYIYFGGVFLKSTPDIVIPGSNPNAGLGWRCAIGDFNDDSFNDLAIRGFYQSGQGFSYGYLNIYLGGAQIDTIVDLTSPKASTAFFLDDLSAFDVNGDDRVDLLWTFADSSQRSIFIHYGGNDFAQRFQTRPDFVIHAPAGSGLWGSELSNAGDMNGDGYNDIAIGAYATAQGNGIIFVYTAGKALDDRFDAARGQTLEGNFGSSVDRVGDINDDGFSDIIVGAPRQPWHRDEGYFGIFLGDSRIPTGVKVEPTERTPTNFLLRPGFPNPFTYETIFEFGLSRRAMIEVKVFDVLGKEVKNLLYAEHAPGQYKVLWNGRDQSGETVPSGIYLVRMRAFASGSIEPLFEQTQKFTFLK
jgi:hypothetical protein